jgi:nucleoside-diphosphate-sugar epimerase
MGCRNHRIDIEQGNFPDTAEQKENPLKVLITGCAGHVGQAVTTHLLQRGFAIRGIDRADSCPSKIDYRSCEILDAAALAPHVEGVDAVLHLAAIPSPGRAPNADIFQINTAGTFNIFDACAHFGIERVVVASSINAVGYFFGAVPFELDYLPADENNAKYPSDAYSFSKQITEEIGEYFWRRDQISNTCLRFGAGLRAINELREGMAESSKSVKDLLDNLGAMPPQQCKTEVQRMRDAYDAERRERRWEKRDGKKSVLSADEQRLITMRQNYFSFVALEDACRAMELSLTASYNGSHPLLIVDKNNTLMTDAAQLAAVMYPDVVLRGQLAGTQSLVDWRRAIDLLGFETEIAAAALFA